MAIFYSVVFFLKWAQNCYNKLSNSHPKLLKTCKYQSLFLKIIKVSFFSSFFYFFWKLKKTSQRGRARHPRWLVKNVRFLLGSLNVQLKRKNFLSAEVQKHGIELYTYIKNFREIVKSLFRLLLTKTNCIFGDDNKSFKISSALILILLTISEIIFIPVLFNNFEAHFDIFEQFRHWVWYFLIFSDFILILFNIFRCYFDIF